VKIRAAVRLTDILSHTERSISALLQAPLAHRIVVEGAGDSPGDVIIGPYPHEDGRAPAAVQHMPIRPFSSWNRDNLTIRLGLSAAVDLSVEHTASDEELGIRTIARTEAEQAADLMYAGYRAAIGVWRTRPSGCLATFLACSIAQLNGTVVVDTSFLSLGAPIAPEPLLTKLAEHRNAASFEDLAERFCDAIGLRFGA
jgi:hypothetical protein